MNRLITLEWIPLNQYAPGIIYKGYREYEELKLLIQSYSWPETFDGAAFDAVAERWEGFDRVRSKAEEPVNKVEELQVNLNWNQDMLRYHADRFCNGLWDNDPSKSAREVAGLEQSWCGKRKVSRMWRRSWLWR
jgi:hypothetical protein